MLETCDETLMIEVRQGRLDALAPLFERYQGPLLNFFHRLTGDREASRDLVQTVFERLLRYRHTFRDDARFRPWIYQTARHAVADHWRRTSRQPLPFTALAREGDSEDEQGAADPGGSAADSGWRRQRDARDLQEALHRLPEDDREILVLSRFHGLRYDEIATIMKKSAGAVKVQAHRAMHALRRIYFEQEAAHEA